MDTGLFDPWWDPIQVGDIVDIPIDGIRQWAFVLQVQDYTVTVMTIMIDGSTSTLITVPTIACGPPQTRHSVNAGQYRCNLPCDDAWNCIRTCCRPITHNLVDAIHTCNCHVALPLYPRRSQFEERELCRISRGRSPAAARNLARWQSLLTGLALGLSPDSGTFWEARPPLGMSRFPLEWSLQRINRLAERLLPQQVHHLRRMLQISRGIAFLRTVRMVDVSEYRSHTRLLPERAPGILTVNNEVVDDTNLFDFNTGQGSLERLARIATLTVSEVESLIEMYTSTVNFSSDSD